MQHALTWLMTGPAPQERSGDAPERRSGWVSTADMIEAIKFANEPQIRAIENLERTMCREFHSQTATLASRLDTLEGRTAALETWKELQEDAALVRQGKLAVTLGAIRLLAANYRLVWAIVVFVLGLVWMLTGNQPVGVGPIQP